MVKYNTVNDDYSNKVTKIQQEINDEYSNTLIKNLKYNKTFSSLRLRHNGHHFAYNIFKCLFLTENLWIMLKVSLKFVPNVWINDIPA